MAEKKLLILRLEGALQGWDAASKWDERGVEEFPTKSGVLGLLGCALGLERGAPELAELNEAITMAVRTDRRGDRFTDFQTVTGTPLRNAEGKPKVGWSKLGYCMLRRTYNESLTDRVGMRDGEVDKVTHSLDRSFAFAIFIDGRFGTFSTNRLEEEALHAFILNAIGMARMLVQDPCRSLPAPELSWHCLRACP